MRPISKREEPHLVHTYAWEPDVQERIRDPHMEERFRDRQGNELEVARSAKDEARHLGASEVNYGEDTRS